jgi:prolyl oligopeptidase
MRTAFAAFSAALTIGLSPVAAQVDRSGDDPFLWLEDAQGARALAWVAAENAKTEAVLQADARFRDNYAALIKMASGTRYVPPPSLLGDGVAVFTADASHPRGALQWATLADYQAPTPQWRTLIDVGALDAADGQNWLIPSIDCPPRNAHRCLVTLSAGGEDAAELREFDLRSGAFVSGGFRLPRGVQVAGWVDPDTLIVARDWGAGTTTAAGYPFVVKLLRRGDELSAAKEVFRGEPSDANVWPWVLCDGQGDKSVLIQRARDIYHTETYLLAPSGIVRLAVPPQATLRGLFAGKLVFTLEEDWRFRGQTMRAGTLVAVPLAWLAGSDLQRGAPDDSPMAVFQPGPRESIEDVATLRERIAVTYYDNVRGRLVLFSNHGERGWAASPVPVPDNATVDIFGAVPGGTGSLPNVNLWTTGRPDSNTLFYRVSSFLEPEHGWQLNGATGNARSLAAQPATFEATADVTEQFEATAPDGTRIPYFVVHPKGMKLDGDNPTILTGYGGWRVIEAPYYDPVIGALWLSRGGVFVLANIRGGGEFGPAWHDAAVKTHRQVVFDDFTAVARDLIARKITRPERLGMMGASNGGLVVGVSLVQHPELWNAAVMDKPILDLMRFEKIARGAAGVGEYGSTAQANERAMLIATSPYANLRAGVRYPPPLLLTNTQDDRSGPAHARKFAARLGAMGDPYFFYEVGEGGHAGSHGATLNQQALTSALEMTYFAQRLMDPLSTEPRGTQASGLSGEGDRMPPLGRRRSQ